MRLPPEACTLSGQSTLYVTPLFLAICTGMLTVPKQSRVGPQGGLAPAAASKVRPAVLPARVVQRMAWPSGSGWVPNRRYMKPCEGACKVPQPHSGPRLRRHKPLFPNLNRPSTQYNPTRPHPTSPNTQWPRSTPPPRPHPPRSGGTASSGRSQACTSRPSASGA